jgi:DNA processing protein
MTHELESVLVAVVAFELYGTPAQIRDHLVKLGREGVLAEAAANPEMLTSLEEQAQALFDRGVRVVLFGDADFPSRLMSRGQPIAPVFFYVGNRALFYRAGVGMCGSRHVTDKGMFTAEKCGESVAARRLTVVSGYAAGVDTATHLGALRAGGDTVIVLAEGIDHFRIKRAFASEWDYSRILVISQFAPSQVWRAHAAMTRNAVIYGMPNALLVIEAGARGGTLAAGEGAIKIGRPVLVVDFGEQTPEGNQILLRSGGLAVRTLQGLHERLAILASDGGDDPPSNALF